MILAGTCQSPQAEAGVAIFLTRSLGRYFGISPEQAGRAAREVDTSTGLYSLEVMLFELLIGQRPWSPSNANPRPFLAGPSRTWSLSTKNYSK